MTQTPAGLFRVLLACGPVWRTFKSGERVPVYIVGDVKAKLILEVLCPLWDGGLLELLDSALFCETHAAKKIAWALEGMQDAVLQSARKKEMNLPGSNNRKVPTTRPERCIASLSNMLIKPIFTSAG